MPFEVIRVSAMRGVCLHENAITHITECEHDIVKEENVVHILRIRLIIQQLQVGVTAASTTNYRDIMRRTGEILLNGIVVAFRLDGNHLVRHQIKGKSRILYYFIGRIVAYY